MNEPLLDAVSDERGAGRKRSKVGTVLTFPRLGFLGRAERTHWPHLLFGLASATAGGASLVKLSLRPSSPNPVRSRGTRAKQHGNMGGGNSGKEQTNKGRRRNKENWVSTGKS